MAHASARIQAALNAIGPHDIKVVLPVGDDLLAECCVSPQSQALLNEPGQDVEARVTKKSKYPDKVLNKVHCYIDGLLIQSRGELQETWCDRCERGRGRGNYPFFDCRVADGHFDNSCGNCKWRNWAASCTCGLGIPRGQYYASSSAAQHRIDTPSSEGNVTGSSHTARATSIESNAEDIDEDMGVSIGEDEAVGGDEDEHTAEGDDNGAPNNTIWHRFFRLFGFAV